MDAIGFLWQCSGLPATRHHKVRLRWLHSRTQSFDHLDVKGAALCPFDMTCVRLLEDVCRQRRFAVLVLSGKRLIASQAFIRGWWVVKTFSVYTVGDFFDIPPRVGVFFELSGELGA
ncbi:hypothetical protein [Nocardia sp. NPDC047648]|uniref:hypothetical protein n=1 Tax=Nocardia sp. NPDC047648 TaxID=3155625 RepID=UPI0033C44B41